MVVKEKANCEETSTVTSKDRGRGTRLKVGTEQVRGYLDVFTSAGPSEIHPRMLQELSTIVYQSFWLLPLRALGG